jgi:hypothetical protein
VSTSTPLSWLFSHARVRPDRAGRGKSFGRRSERPISRLVFGLAKLQRDLRHNEQSLGSVPLGRWLIRGIGRCAGIWLCAARSWERPKRFDKGASPLLRRLRAQTNARNRSSAGPCSARRLLRCSRGSRRMSRPLISSTRHRRRGSPLPAPDAISAPRNRSSGSTRRRAHSTSNYQLPWLFQPSRKRRPSRCRARRRPPRHQSFRCQP